MRSFSALNLSSAAAPPAHHAYLTPQRLANAGPGAPRQASAMAAHPASHRYSYTAAYNSSSKQQLDPRAVAAVETRRAEQSNASKQATAHTKLAQTHIPAERIQLDTTAPDSLCSRTTRARGSAKGHRLNPSSSWVDSARNPLQPPSSFVQLQHTSS